MFLDVDLTGAEPAVRLQEANALDSLKVVVRGGELGRPRLDGALTGVGRLEPSGDVLLEIDALKRLSGSRGTDPDWLRAFDGMVEYARSKGWVGAGETLQAHCEWV
jgi:hypothetical protein